MLTRLFSLLLSLGLVGGLTAASINQLQPLVDQSAQTSATASINAIVEAANAYYDTGLTWSDALNQAAGESLQNQATTITGSTVTWQTPDYCYQADTSPGSAVTINPC